MKRNILNKLVIILIFVCFVLMLMTIKSDAASLSISTSKSSVSPGGSFTVTVSVSGGAGKVSSSVSNGSGGKTAFLDNGSYSFTCTAGRSGSVTISASGTIADYNTEKESTKSASRIVKIVSNSGGNSSSGSSSGKSSSNSSSGGSSSGNYTTTQPQQTEKSSDSSLSSLSVKDEKISPKFNKDVKEYTLTIPYEKKEIDVKATTSDAKARVEIKGNKDLKEGENTVTVIVTAENGSISNYIIKVTRARVPLSLKSLIIKYENQNGELIEAPLNPEYEFNTLEYYLQDLEYWVEKISIEAIPNIEGATVDIQGADTLQVGENTITIILKALEDSKNLKEGEEPKEETITYTIKVNKLQEPTTMTKIENWSKGVMGTISNWFGQNEEKVIIGALGVCNVALLGLSVYIVLDYRKYKDVIKEAKKVKKDKKIDMLEKNVSEGNILEEIHKTTNNAKEEVIEDKKEVDENNKNGKPKVGKHF